LNISSLLTGKSRKADQELIERYHASEVVTDEETAAFQAAVKRENRATAPKHGPSKTRTMSNGQYRRLLARDAASEKRKGNRRYRRAWMSQTQDLANLRGRIAVVENQGLAGTPLWLNASKSIIREFGGQPGDPVQTAKETLAAAVKQRS